MPFIVRILAEDVDLWQEYQHASDYTEHEPTYKGAKPTVRTPGSGLENYQVLLAAGRHHYELKQTIFDHRLARIKVIAPGRLDALIGHDLFCNINTEKGYLNKHTGEPPRTTLFLKHLNRTLVGSPRLLRLRIKSWQCDHGRAPKIVLEEM